jgi:integrase
MNRNKQKEKQKEKSSFPRVGECLYRCAHNGIYYFKGQIRGREFTRSLKTTDRALANRLLADKKRELAQLDHAAADKTTLAALCDLYRPTFADQKPHTRAIKERILRRITDDWPTGKFTRLGEVRPSDCKRWLAQYQFGVSTRNDHVWLLKDVFALAVQDRLLVVSPAAQLKGKRRDDPKRLTPTLEQFQEIITSVRAQKFNGHGAEESADFLEFMGLAGLGQAELSSLTRGDVDLKAEQISVLRHKTSKRFRVPIYPQLRPLLEKLCKDKRHNEELFALADGKKALAGACKRLGFPAFSQRSLRRMFITRAIERGVDVKVIADWQGHRDGGKLILDTYSHVRPVHSQRMAQLMTADEPENVVRLPKEQIS